MKYDEHINRFQNLLHELHFPTTDFEVWLNRCQELIVESFGVISPQVSSINTLRGDFGVAKIFDKSIRPEQIHKEKFKQYIEGLIRKLEEDKVIAIRGYKQKLAIKQNDEKNAIEKNEFIQSSLAKPEELPKDLKKLKLESTDPPKMENNIYKTLFYMLAGAVAVVVPFLYQFAKDSGYSKFDADKNALYEQNVQLKKDTSILNARINYLEDSMKKMNSDIVVNTTKSKSIKK